MLDFRPHKLHVISFVAGGRDQDGVMLPDIEKTEEVQCRIEPNGSASQVRFSDGVAHNYSYKIYLDHDCRTFSIGERIRLIGANGEELENDKDFRVIGFFRNQLNALLWV